MSSLTFFFVLVLIIAVLFLVLNFALAPHNPYQEKYSIFECGFHSFLGQNRTQFGIKFFIFGLAIVLIFTIIITIGFVFELSKNALKIESRQTLTNLKKSNVYLDSFSEF